jgi:hypothetical protein
MTKDELVRVVRRIMDAEGTEAELDGLLALVERNVPHPAVTDLIFYPPNGVDLSAEQVVEIALTYQPVELSDCGEQEKKPTG